MKNALSTLWLLLVAVLLAASCQEEEPVNEIPGVSQSTWTTGVTIAADETSVEYTFQAAGPWIASSQQSWCSITSKGEAGASTLTLTFEPNTSKSERTTLISIAFPDGYKGDSFVVTQEGNADAEEPVEEGPAVNQYFDDFLANYYLWNAEYKAMERDFTIPYVNDSEKNFFVKSLKRLGQTTGANNLDYKNGHLYSYVTRTPSTRTAATRAAGEEIDHSDQGIEKTMTDSYGIIPAPIILSFQDQTGADTGTDGIIVQAIYPGSPAEKAGLQRGDIIAQIDGQDITDWYAVYYDLTMPAAGSTITVGLNEPGIPTHTLTTTRLYPTPVLAHEVFEVGGARLRRVAFVADHRRVVQAVADEPPPLERHRFVVFVPHDDLPGVRQVVGVPLQPHDCRKTGLLRFGAELVRQRKIDDNLPVVASHPADRRQPDQFKSGRGHVGEIFFHFADAVLVRRHRVFLRMKGGVIGLPQGEDLPVRPMENAVFQLIHFSVILLSGGKSQFQKDWLFPVNNSFSHVPSPS